MLTNGKIVATGVTAVAIFVVATTVARSASTEQAGRGCPAAVASAVLPDWAHSGFSDPVPSAPYVLGDRGEIVAILFGDLAVPEKPDPFDLQWGAQHDTLRLPYAPA
jgi:hypothetical protein